MKTYEELKQDALQALKGNDDLFVSCVDELDAWNGYADGFRCYEMYMLNELFYDTKVSDFLDMITTDFNHNDEYFYESIYGIESTDSKVDLYRENVWESELLDAIIDNIDNIDLAWIDSDFAGLIESIAEYTFAYEGADSFFEMLKKYDLEQVGELEFKITYERRPSDSFETLKAYLRDFAISWQEGFNSFDYAFSDLAAWSDFFETYGKKYDLLEEFHENGVA